jgi:hypothetical protein
MNEEQVNMDVRKFLKRFGVSAQREIEKAIQGGVESGTLSDTATVRVRARLTIEGSADELVIEEDIRLA